MAENIKGSIINESNRGIDFGEDTGIDCPVCHAASKSTLKVRATVDDQASLECPNCGYSIVKKVGEINPTDIRGRPIKVK